MPPLALILHWAVGIPALLLLFFPVDALLPAGAQQRSYEQILASRSEVGLRPWRWHLLWMLEPVRAFLAAWLFQEVLKSNQAHVWPPAFGIALAFGVVLQLWTKREPLTAWAPIGFCAGLLLVILPWPFAIAAIVGGAAAILWMRTWSAFFLAGAVILALAALYQPVRANAALGAWLLVLPLAARVLFQCKLVLPSRA